MKEELGLTAVPKRYLIEDPSSVRAVIEQYMGDIGVVIEADMEAIDIIMNVLGHEGSKAFCKGTALAYLIRSGKKAGATVEEDHQKAQFYLALLRSLDGNGSDPRSYRS